MTKLCAEPSSKAGLVITADVLHTQETTAQTIVDAVGDYLMVVKENQPALRDEIKLVFETLALADTVIKACSTTTHGN